MSCDTWWDTEEHEGLMGDMCGSYVCEADIVHVAEGDQFDFDWLLTFPNEGGVSPGLAIELSSSAPEVLALSEVETSVWSSPSSTEEDDPSCEPMRSIHASGHLDARRAGSASLQLIEGDQVIDALQIVVSKIDAFHFAWEANGTSGNTASSATLTVPSGGITYITPVALSSTGQELKLGSVKWTQKPAKIFELWEGHDYYEDKGLELHAKKEGTVILRAEVGSVSHELTITVGPSSH